MHSDGFVTIHSTRLSPLRAGPQEEPLAKRFKCTKHARRDMICVVLIINETWEQMKTAYANGIGVREIARNMSLPEGTVLARAKRQGWTRQLQSAKRLAKREDAVFCHSG